MSGEPPAIPDYVAASSDLSSDQYNDEIVGVLRWLIDNVPRGPQGTDTTIDASDTTTSTAIDAGLSITFTAVNGRKYEHRIAATWASTIGSTVCRVLVTDGSNNILTRFDILLSTTGIADFRYIEWTETPPGGSTTRKIRIVRPTGGGSGEVSRFADTDRPSHYEIRDAGSA